MLEAAELGHKVAKDVYEARVPALRVELLEEQFALRTMHYPVIVVVAGDDRRGSNEILNLLSEWLDARYIDMAVYSHPSDEETSRPLYWRYWRTMPPRGRIGVFHDAWTVTTIRRRLQGEYDDAELERAIQRVRGFERMLVADGALVLKFWLHMPAAELARRMKKEKDHEGRGMLTVEDRQVHREYESNRPLVESIVRRTSTGDAPWHIIESTQDRYRNLAVGERLLAALRRHRQEATAPRPEEPPFARATEDPLSVLDAVDLGQAMDQTAYRERMELLQPRIHTLSRLAYERGVSSVIVFEGWDAAGKGGVIRRVTAALDARLYRVVPISAPSAEEQAHHYLWRFWRHVPSDGRMTIFDRSWYGRVLVERVEGYARPSEWRRAYTEIGDFEEQLHHHGTLVLKFWLHIDADEQLRRFQEREQTPFKKHKMSAEDYRNRARWHDYELAADEMVARTSTDYAPWHAIAANDKRVARVAVLEAIAAAFERALGVKRSNPSKKRG